MNLDSELRELLGRVDEAPWPGEAGAYDRFLRRRARRGRAVAAGAALALVGILAGAVLVPRLVSTGPPTATPTAEKVRVESGGFELTVPRGWRVARELTGTRRDDRTGVPRSTVIGVVLRPRAASPARAEIMVTTDDNPKLDRSIFQQGSRRPDGLDYRLHPGIGRDGVGRYALLWPDFCTPRIGCMEGAYPRVLWVSGSAASGREQVLETMREIVTNVRRITDALPPPPPPDVPDTTKVQLGSGGSGRTAWEAWIEPLDGNAGFSVRFLWLLEHGKKGQGMHWESLEPGMLQQRTTYTLTDCLFWVPGNGLVLSGLANKNVATVRFELKNRDPVTVRTFGRDKQLPWVAYVSPVLRAGTGVTRVVALDAAGNQMAVDDSTFGGGPLCWRR
jgi:hypothetical protein